MTIIDQLKQNEKPFGLMSEEMQAKARGIGITDNFRQFVGPGWGGIYKATGLCFNPKTAYQLRADYEDEPEIVECEIYTQKDSVSGWMQRRYMDAFGNSLLLSSAINNPDFIGFKFDDGKMYPISTVYKFKGKDVTYYSIDIDRLDEYTVLHAAHVLFKKQE